MEEPLSYPSDIAGKGAFGAENRKRLMDIYFAGENGTLIGPENAWKHVYKLLLWTDQTTGLAHCYESDKSQPGKNWYARSLAFHDWLSTSFGVLPGALADSLDWLFIRATKELASEVLKRSARVSEAAARQRAPYSGRDFPKPGEDPELVSIVKDVLGASFGSEPSAEDWQLFVQRVRQYVSLENKRKNLLGEGFEDVLGQIVARCNAKRELEVYARRSLQELPGFANAKRGEKINKVDLAVVRGDRRTLVTAKWSVRADREKQFVTDFTDYVHAESYSKPFEYVFVTNEFDPARLRRACERLATNAPMFTHVVHINTDALRATYGDAQEPTMREVLSHMETGRLISLESWLRHLGS